MDRITATRQTHLTTITAIEDTQGAPDTPDAQPSSPDARPGSSPCHWLSPAMAIWMAAEGAPQRLDRLDRTPARTVR
jgi:hypothetical protein